MGKKYRMITKVQVTDNTFAVGEDSPNHPGLRVSQIDFMQTGAQGIYSPINIPAPHYRVSLEDPYHPEDNVFRIIPLSEVKAVDFQEITEADSDDTGPVRAE